METTEWIKRVDEALVKLDEKPQFGTSSPFPWEAIRKALASLVGQGDVTLGSKELGWLPLQKAVEGVGEPHFTLKVHLTPLHAPLYWLVSESTLKSLMIELLSGEKAASAFLEPDLVIGFYRFLAVEVLGAIDESGFARGLSFQIAEFDGALENATYYTSDITLSRAKHTFSSRLLIPGSLRTEWKSYLAKQPPPPLSAELKAKLPVEIALEAGSAEMTLEEWERARVGDWVILDKTGADDEGKISRLVLTVGGTPIFRGKRREGGVKLLAYPVYEEVTTMTEDEDEDEEQLDEETLSKLQEGGDDEELPERAEPQGALNVTPGSIPVKLTVEVGRLQMTAAELMKLSAGMTLELPVSPEQGVDLVLNGKKVGKGELVKLGEVLGVRILSL